MHTLHHYSACSGQTVLQTRVGEQPVNIKSPNYPGKLWVTRAPGFRLIRLLFTDNYNNNATEEWTIVAPSGQVVSLVFDTFSIESGYDYVRVFDGCTMNDTLIGNYSGDNLPDPILSTGNVLHITFTSDKDTTRRGFTATAIAIDLAGKLIL